MTKKQAGVTAGIVAALMWAIEAIFIKLSYASTGVLHTSAWRAVIAMLVAFAYVLLTTRHDMRLKRKHLPGLFYAAAVGTFLGDLLYLYALSIIPVTNAILIGHMQPVMIILIGYFILKSDRITLNDYAGIFLLILASLLVTTRTLDNLLAFDFGTRGDALMLVCTFAWATAGIAARKYLQDMDPGLMAFYRLAIASLALVSLLALRGGMAPPNHYQVLGGITVGVGIILYCTALVKIKAAQVAALELCAPFFAAILGYFVLSEKLTLMQSAGICIVFGGVYFISKREEDS